MLEGVLDFAKTVTARCLKPGAVAVDATVGNGHDTLFLARQVGPSGRVHGFDVQAEALRSTRCRLDQAGVAECVVLHQQGHESMREALPPEVHGRVQAVMFNLGYLPGGSDKTCTTHPATTLPALDAAAELLAPGGVITVVLYTGHPGGSDEAAAVRAWAEALPQEKFRALSYRFVNQQNDPPRLLVVQRHMV